MPHDVILAGCSPAPIASYLGALAMLRLVGEQVDRDARGWCSGEAFVLRSELDANRLLPLPAPGLPREPDRRALERR